MFYDIYTDLCAQKGVSESKAAESVGLNRSAVAKWKKGSVPGGQTMQRLATYFDVPIDLLLGCPPFDYWTAINQDRSGFLRSINADPGLLEWVWGIKMTNPDEAPTKYFIDFLSEAIEYARPIEDGRWSIGFRPKHEFLKNSNPAWIGQGNDPISGNVVDSVSRDVGTMSDPRHRGIMARNIRRLMDARGKTRDQICDDLGFCYTTFSDWVNGNAYPSIDKIEKLANYFGVPKTVLVEDYPFSPIYAIEAERTLIPFVASILKIPQDAVSIQNGVISVADGFENQLDIHWVDVSSIIRYLIEVNFPMYTHDKKESILLSRFHMLNEDGKNKLLERLEELNELPKYCINDTVPNTPPEGD